MTVRSQSRKSLILKDFTALYQSTAEQAHSSAKQGRAVTSALKTIIYSQNLQPSR
jgi:hypothetical protein